MKLILFQKRVCMRLLQVDYSAMWVGGGQQLVLSYEHALPLKPDWLNFGRLQVSRA